MTPYQRKLAGHRGKNLEAVIIASQGSIVRLHKHDTCGRWIKRAFRPIKSPVDFIGCLRAPGARAVYLDAKECDLQYRFPVGNEDHFSTYQREFLQLFGASGAIAGLLIEATHPEIRAYFWLSWRHLFTAEASIAWSDGRMVCIGSNLDLVKFQNVIAAEAAVEEARRIA